MRNLIYLTCLIAASVARAGVIDDRPLPIDVDAASLEPGGNPIVYDNSAGQFAVTLSDPVCDDGSFSPTAATPFLISSVNIGFRNRGTHSGQISFSFYRTLLPGGQPVTQDLIPNSTNTTNIGLLGPGIYQTGFMDVIPFELPLGGGGATTWLGNWAIRVNYGGVFDPLYAGGPQSAGSSADMVWVDPNVNGCADPSEERTFGGGAQRASLFLQLRGTPVPEPAGILPALLVLAAFRRRSEGWRRGV